MVANTFYGVQKTIVFVTWKTFYTHNIILCTVSNDKYYLGSWRVNNLGCRLYRILSIKSASGAHLDYV